MKVRIIAVGKLSAMWKPPCMEYEKRLSRFCTLEILETPEGKGEDQKARQQEGERMLRLIPTGAEVIALDVSGKEEDSLAFSARIGRLESSGKTACFLIGGSTGFSPEVLACVKERVSFSSMTFCHQLARTMLLEQLYRGFKILRNEPYHK